MSVFLTQDLFDWSHFENVKAEIDRFESASRSSLWLDRHKAELIEGIPYQREELAHYFLPRFSPGTRKYRLYLSFFERVGTIAQNIGIQTE